MNSRNRLRLLGAALLGASAISAVGFPHTRTFEPVLRPIGDEIVRPMANDCTYRVTIAGTMRTMRSMHAGDGRALYEPELTIDPRVSCGGARTMQTIGVRTIRGGTFDADRLAARVARVATVTRDDANGARCRATPTVHVDAAGIRLLDVRESCTQPMHDVVGGGPRSR